MARPKSKTKAGKRAVNGARVREIRELRGMSQPDLAEKADTYAHVISRIENEHHEITTPLFKRIVAALACSSDYLLSLSDVAERR